MTKVALPKTRYKLADEQSLRYGPAIALPEVMNFDESRMSIWLDYADGNRRDGVGDLLDIGGISLERHRPNPVVLFEHGKQKDWMLPVAMAEDRDSHEYTVVLNLPAKKACLNAFFYQGCGEKELVTKGYPTELKEDKDKEYKWAWFCEQLYHMMINRYIRGGSIGYQTIQAEAIPPDYQRGIPAGQHLIKTLQLEGSVVVMPANMDTVRKSYSEFYDVVHKALCLPHCCGKPIHPYLVKSLTDCLPCGEKRMKAQLGWEPKGETEFVGDLQWLKDEQEETEHQKHLRKKYKAFSGKKKDKLGRQRCYSGGKPVPCSQHQEPKKGPGVLSRVGGAIGGGIGGALGGGLYGVQGALQSGQRGNRHAIGGVIAGGVSGAAIGGVTGAVTGGVVGGVRGAASGTLVGSAAGALGGNYLAGRHGRRVDEEFQHAAGHNMARNAEKAEKKRQANVHAKKVSEGRVQLIGHKPQNIIKGKPGNISIKPTKSIKSLRTKYKSVGGVVGGAIGGVVGGVAGTVGGAYAGAKIHKKNPIVGAAVGSQAGGVAGMAGGAAVGAHIRHAISSMGSKKPAAPVKPAKVTKSPGAPGKKGIAGRVIGGAIGGATGAAAGFVGHRVAGQVHPTPGTTSYLGALGSGAAGAIAGAAAGQHAGHKIQERLSKPKKPGTPGKKGIIGNAGKLIGGTIGTIGGAVAGATAGGIAGGLAGGYAGSKLGGLGGSVLENVGKRKGKSLKFHPEEDDYQSIEGMDGKVSQKSLRIKYRSSVKRLRRRLKSSSPGSSVIYIRHKDLHNLQKLAGERGLKLQHMAQDAKTHKIKLTGDDGVIDQLAKNYGLSLPGAHTKRI